ncbi:MAG TPA: alkaline phosphatase family protein, partial [Trebonia sp.]|nr:alkaline phosphatase family protein [Trebonia sp.]
MFALLIGSAAFVTGQPGSALAAANAATAATAATPAATATAAATAGGTEAAPGTNLLLNANATAGDTSAQGWDAVTIPGWQITGGLPTVVRYGTPGFPKIASSWPAGRGNLFAGGAGGTATLVQQTPVTQGARYDVAAWLGGTKTSAAHVTVQFEDASGTVRATATIGPVGQQASPVLAYRQATGTVPAGATRARVTITLATTLTDDNGPNAPQVGYNDAAAANLSLTLSQPSPSPGPLTPPTATVPGYQHVFLFYFENEDYGQVIGNTKQAPFLNSLRASGATLTNFYAEEHPSDANYLALAGGSAFGVPLTDPEEENPLYTINAPNIGDLVSENGESWKAYTQSANGPCDDTVHGYYWNDDQPMLYFQDVRDRPRYCASHVVPLEELPADLANPATTPNFAWIAPDDCSDMEGCGIAAGDSFLKTELTEIMNSPAWRTQRSLAIITFDEDNTDYQHPAQRVPTIVIASSGVKAGYSDPTRYTHYSLLRTIEAALGLGTLTANDRYAQPLNNIFYPERTLSSAPQSAFSASGGASAAGASATAAAAEAATAAPPGTAGFLAAAARARQPVAWVANYGSNTVSPVDLTTGKAGGQIPVGAGPRAVAATPDGATIYVANSQSDTVTPIAAATGKPGKPILVGDAPWALAVTPDGTTLYVANSGSGTVTPVSTASDTPGAPIAVGEAPRAIAMAPDGRTAYVLNWLSGTVTPLSTATNTAGQPIRVGAFPVAAAFSPHGETLYVANFGADTVTPIATGSNRPGWPVPAGYAPDALAATGQGVYVVDGNSDEVARLGAGTATRVGYSPDAIAVSGTTAYVVNTIAGTVTPLDTSTGQAAAPLSVGLYSYPTSVVITGKTAVVLDTYAGQLSLINTATRHVAAPIT